MCRLAKRNDEHPAVGVQIVQVLTDANYTALTRDMFGERRTDAALAERMIEDLTSDLAVSSPQVDVQIDRDKSAALGVTANQIENAFYDAYGPRWVSTIYAAVNEYKVLLELLPEFQADPSALSYLYFKGSPTSTPTTTAAAAAQRTANATVTAVGSAPTTASPTMT